LTTNAELVRLSDTLNSVTEFKCGKNARLLSGNLKRYCTFSGWSGQPAYCEPLMCFPPETIENGNIVNLKQGMYPVDSFVNYECRPGYVALYGEKTRQCLASTEWSGVPPTCVEIMCPYLSRPTNCDLIQTGSGYNSIAEYTCHFGYRFASNITLALNGLFRRRCNESALWDFYEPTCERKIVYFLNLNASLFSYFSQLY
jgi:hypothetical protein